MYLKRIEVKGFKSFADKIDLDFNKGITAVVGPNGSGKSNVADAIKWVLGEQSAKSLRGAKMEDVIFAGTEKRGALGYAEVAITIDNQDHLIDFDYSEITVKRRLYRTGESEYYINGTQCRLKDILEVFMDTGIGKDGYSLIGQGKIEEILSTRSEDRRHLFEEAAGIGKYKWRKNEAERKLENTRQNLLRIDDIIEELEGQIEPLEVQAENAKKYLSYRDKLKEIEVNLLSHNYEGVKGKLNKCSEEEAKLKKSKEEYEVKRNLLQIDIDTLKDELKSIEEEGINLTKKVTDMEKSFENKQGNLKLLNERHDNLIKEKARIEEDIKEEKKTIVEIKNNRDNIASKENIEQENLLKIKEELSTLQQQYNKVYEKCAESDRLIEGKKSDAIQILKDLSDISNKVNSCEVNIRNLENRKSQILRESKVKEERKENLNKEIQESKSEINKIEKLIEKINLDITEIRKEILNEENSLSVLMEDRNKTFDTLKQKEARFSTLSSMESDMEGFSRAVKSVIRRYKDENEVFGTVSDIINVPKGYEVAVEIALASSLQNIVVKDENIARDAIEYLKKNNLGRATFYPLTTIKGKYANINDNVKSIKGFIGIASNIVQCKDEFKNIISSLLGRVILCESLVSAKEIANKTNYTFRIVTLDGDVINSGGSYTGGSTNLKNSGLISRKNTIEALKSDIEQYKKKLQDIENSIQIKKTIIQGEKSKEVDKSKEYQNLSMQFNNENAKIKSIEDSLKITASDINDLSLELEQIDFEVANNNTFSKKALEEKESLLLKQSSLDDEINSLMLSFKDENKLKEDIQNNITKVKIKFTEITKSIEGLQERISILNRDTLSHERRINIFSNKILDTENSIFQTQEETKIIIADIQGVSQNLIDEKNKITEIEASKKSKYEKREHTEKESLKVDDSIASLLESIHKFDIQKSKLEMEVEGIKARLWENYELTIPEAISKKVAIVSFQEEEKKVQNIKGVIKSLGHININAIEEYQKVKERYEFLSTQKNDLEEAEDSLMKVIEEMTIKMRSQFTEKFKIMKENFNITFKELFGGGYADLKMDGDDPLVSGIDIIVQPPGKKLQSLTLLSGGEKGLSAIALIFAILKMKPTPFCVLDEIEAALDDANVNRYAKFLKEYSKNTQFIIITHRKGSMAVADSLYGVTMEEKGISKILSLKLEGGN